MDIDDIEKNLGRYPSDPTKFMSAIFETTVENNALLRIIIAELSDSNYHEKELLEEANKLKIKELQKLIKWMEPDDE